MKMYRLVHERIEQHEVIRTTEKQVVWDAGNGKERREVMVCRWYSWHPTWQEAHTRMLNDAQMNADSLRLRLQRANDDLGRIKGMKEPT